MMEQRLERRTFNMPGEGLRCGDCGHVLARVARTKASENFIQRERVCPSCGKLNATTERVIATRTIRGRKHLE